MSGQGLTARPGRQWSRRFNHPYTARKTPPGRWVPIFGTAHHAPWTVLNSTFGPIYGFRGYNTPQQGVPAAWPGDGVGAIPAGVPPAGQVISFKPDITQTLAGTLDGALATFFATVPAGAFVSCWHEGEIFANVTPADLIAMHTRVYGIFQKNAPVAASYGQIVSTASAFSGGAGFPLGQWISSSANGGANLDFYGIDINPNTQTTTFADTVGTTMTAMINAGVAASGPWTITEVSSIDAYRAPQAQWLSDGWNVAQAIGALHYLAYFNNDDPQAILHWPPVSGDTQRVLQDIAAVSRGDPRSLAAALPARSTTAALVSSASSTGLTATFSSNPAAGSKVIAVVQAGFAATLTVTDNGTTPATFRQDAACLNGSGTPSVFVYRADNITLPSAGTYAVSVARSPAGSLQIAACAYTGVQNGPPSSTSAIIGTSSSLPAVNPVTPDDTDSVFIEAFFANSAQNPESVTSATPEFVLGQTQTNGTSLFTGAVSDAVVADPRPRAGGWTLSDAPANFSAVMAAYGAFPADITIVPGTDGTWAEAPYPDAGISANAGVASASGAALAVYPGHNAGLASALGWAAVSPPVNLVAAGVATATAAANAATITTGISPAAGLAAATGVPLTPVAQVSVTAGLAAATGAANTVTAQPSPSAGLPAGSGAALTPVAKVSATAGLAAATGAALPITTGAVNAGLATATATAAAPVAAVTTRPRNAHGQGWAAVNGPAQAVYPPVYQWVYGPADVHSAGLATGSAAPPFVPGTVTSLTLTAINPVRATGAAKDATVTTGGTANAGVAAATGTAQAPAVTLTVAAGLAAATGAGAAPVAKVTPTLAAAASTGTAGTVTAQASATPAAAAGVGAGVTPVPQVTVTAGLAAGTGAGQAATANTTGAANAGLAAATAAANAATITASASPTAGLAAATGTGTGATAQDGATTGLAAASGAGLNPAVTVTVTPAAAAATGAALNPTVVTGVAPTPAAATSTGTVTAATPMVTVTAGLPAATGAGQSPTPQAAATPTAPAATGTALNPAVTASSNVTATTAAATAAARAPTPQVAPAPAAAAGSVRGVAPTLVLVTLAQAAAAQALATALAAAGIGAADFTVGRLTASVAPGSTLTASTTPGVLVGAGVASGLTATDQRTGGPS